MTAAAALGDRRALRCRLVNAYCDAAGGADWETYPPISLYRLLWLARLYGAEIPEQVYSDAHWLMPEKDRNRTRDMAFDTFNDGARHIVQTHSRATDAALGLSVEPSDTEFWDRVLEDIAALKARDPRAAE